KGGSSYNSRICRSSYRSAYSVTSTAGVIPESDIALIGRLSDWTHQRASCLLAVRSDAKSWRSQPRRMLRIGLRRTERGRIQPPTHDTMKMATIARLTTLCDLEQQTTANPGPPKDSRQ